jgi:hypothetical protein
MDRLTYAVIKMQTVKRRKCGTLMIFVPLDPLTAMTV